MTRRLQTCSTCAGKTRHADRRCSKCRRGLTVVRALRDLPADLRAPTVRELEDAAPIGHLVSVDFRGRGA